AALEASERGARLIFEQAPLGMAVVAFDDRIRKANTTLCEMVGYTEAELTERTPFDITFPEDIERSAQSAQAMLKGAARTVIEKRYVRKNGETVWTSRTACPIRDDSGEAHQFLLMVEDISERKRNEAELRAAKEDADRANHAKSEFLSRMSHELRTPLNAILGFGQLLERQNPTDAQRTRVRYIISAGRHLLNLINEVLDISRIEAGNIQLSLEPVSVAEVLHEALDLMRPLAAERNIELVTATSLDSSCYVSADRQRLKQVLLNLLTNAVKYTPVGGTVTLSDRFCDDETLRLIVTDTGPGIPLDKLSRLFTPFDRLGAEQSGVEGTGLGLALCQRLAHAMRGSIGVQSAPENGSIFWVELPLTESPLERLATQLAVAHEREHVASAQQLRILYIEDNLSNLSLIEQMLAEETDVQLITAMQGQLGFDLARQHLPDLILLDLHLPDLPGWEVLARLQKEKATAEIPVIVISADATSRQIQRLKNAGARDYLTKPLDMPAFYAVIDEARKRLNEVEERAVA
ncbi:MAG: ATP-binding protein, partial [Verrucomicrobiota bacterium]|nr:ATP-binding protein [Verrucomicrobiota bacterium]